MSNFLFILIVILWVGRFFVKAKRKVANTGDAVGETPYAQPAFESLFEEEPSPFQEPIGLDDPVEYFTYESVNSDVDSKVNRPAEPVSVQADAISEEQTGDAEIDSKSFDLRQAVIWQTILQNEYVGNTQCSR